VGLFPLAAVTNAGKLLLFRIAALEHRPSFRDETIGEGCTDVADHPQSKPLGKINSLNHP